MAHAVKTLLRLIRMCTALLTQMLFSVSASAWRRLYDGLKGTGSSSIPDNYLRNACQKRQRMEGAHTRPLGDIVLLSSEPTYQQRVEKEERS